MRILINGLSASAGGGITYLRNVVPHLALRADVQTTLLLRQELRAGMPSADNLVLVDPPRAGGTAERGVFEPRFVRAMIAKSASTILLSAGNFAIRNSPVPQILLSRNALYTSSAFRKDLRARGDYRLLLDTWLKGRLAKRSIQWADCTVAPSQAFARELQEWSGREILSIHHGFDCEFFSCEGNHLAEPVRRQLAQTQGALRLLFVSHYNYYRNFETLFKALADLRERLKDKKVVLILTCKLDGGKDGAYSTASAATMIRELGIADSVIQLGTVPYESLHELYRACDIYVTAAYAETFAHPLVEAMSSGLPVIASDLAVHHEICGESALYFPCFSAEVLTQCVLRLRESPEVLAKLSCAGVTRAEDFSWKSHVNRLLDVAEQLAATTERG